MQLHSLAYTRLRIATLLQLMTDGRQAITQTVTTPANLQLIQPELDRLAAARAPIDALYATPQGSLATPMLAEMDARRDRILSAITHLLRGYALSEDAAEANAAARISHALSPYGDVQSKAFQDETAAITNLAADLGQPDLVAPLALLRLDSWVNRLRTLNQQFNAQYLARDTARPNVSDAPNASDLRPAAIIAWTALASRIEALYITTRNAEPWAATLTLLNNLLDRYAALLARGGGGNNDGQ